MACRASSAPLTSAPADGVQCPSLMPASCASSASATGIRTRCCSSRRSRRSTSCGTAAATTPRSTRRCSSRPAAASSSATWRRADVPVATGAWRARSDVEALGSRRTAEVKRMYVAPSARGRRPRPGDPRPPGGDRGRGRRRGDDPGDRHRPARGDGALRVLRATPECPSFGHYKDEPHNRCFARPTLPTSSLRRWASSANAQDQVDLDHLKDRVTKLEAAVAALQRPGRGARCPTGRRSRPARGSADAALTGEPPWMAEVRALKAQGKQDRGDQAVPRGTGLGLKEAKDVVEAMP